VADRDFDVVVFGATGVTGRQVAAHLAERSAREPIAWAAAARDADRAGSVLAEVGVKEPAFVRADVNDAASLREMAARATVVLDLVGPYAMYGRPVIEACVEAGAHYVDLTGEVPFVREILEAFDDPARRAGVKVVQVCGFEALPADVLVRLAATTARERFGEPVAAVDIEVTAKPPPGPPHFSDVISGGTFQSVALLTGADDVAAAVDPAALIGDAAYAERVRAVSPITLVPRRGDRGEIVAPMVPAPFIDPAVIHRSEVLSAALEGREPQPFRYREGMVLAGGAVSAPFRWAAAGTIAASQGALRALAGSSVTLRRPLAHALSRVGPSSGYGPAPDRMAAWSWSMRLVARTVGARIIRAQIEADGHPGYLSTARMVGESGLMLAREGATPDISGCLTPAVALGAGAADALASARARVTVEP